MNSKDSIFKQTIFKDPDQIFEEVIAKMQVYHPSSDFDIVKRAYELAKNAHTGQKRKSGEPYIVHPLETAKILAEIELDREAIAAGILHDVIEDTDYTYDDLSSMFGAEVAGLVEGVTKLKEVRVNSEFKKDENKQKNRDHRQPSKEEEQAENYRKLFLAMSTDIRVLLIKIADRLHNLRTLGAMPDAKRKRIAQESLDIYAPLAGRLGISTLRRELEDLAFKYSDNESYLYIKAKVGMKVDARQKYMDEIVSSLNMGLKDQGLDGRVKGRAKHFFSIHRKLKRQGGDFSEIFDLFAVRIIVQNSAQCWQALALAHEIFPPMPNKLKNYISNPKPNGYKSIHDVLVGPDNEPFELQIRTEEMHKLAESGIAAHWKYKEGKSGMSAGDDKIAWLAQILELVRENDSNEDFLPLLKGELDIYGGFVHVYTPDGHVKVLAYGSTVVDFAYSVHSAVGNKMVAAKVFGKLVSIDTVLNDGDRVEIITRGNAKGPTKEWLSFAKTSQAKNKIKQWLKVADRDESIARGKELLTIAANEKERGLTLEKVFTPEGEKIVLTKFSLKDFDTLCAAIGRGTISEYRVFNRLHEEYLRQNPVADQTPLDIIDQINKSPRIKHDHVPKGDVIVQGAEDIKIFYSKCCNPVPGDDIIGFVTRGRGVSVHRKACANITSLVPLEKQRLIDVSWCDATPLKNFVVELKITCDGIEWVGKISDVFQKMAVQIETINVRFLQSTAVLNTVIAVPNLAGLEKVVARLLSLGGVHAVDRV